MDDELDDRRYTGVVVGSSPPVPAVWRRAGEEKGDFQPIPNVKMEREIELLRFNGRYTESRPAWNLDEKMFFKEYDGRHNS